MALQPHSSSLMLQALARWKTLFLALSALLVVGLLLSRHLVGPEASGEGPAVEITARDADEHIGNRARVCGKVVGVSHATGIGGEPTFINLDREHPDQPFTALIWGNDRARWSSPPEQQYAGREICVTGTIEDHEGTPQIIVSSPKQVQLR